MPRILQVKAFFSYEKRSHQCNSSHNTGEEKWLKKGTENLKSTLTKKLLKRLTTSFSIILSQLKSGILQNSVVLIGQLQSIYSHGRSLKMSKRYNFSHEQLVEIHSGLKNGCWVNHEVRMELIKMLEDHFIELATSSQVKLIPKK